MDDRRTQAGQLAPGERVIVVGDSGSGKSTLGSELAEALSMPFVELDALFWRPGWQEASDGEFRAAILAATAGERWVVAGNYQRHTVDTIWPRAETIVWLDTGLRVAVWRSLRRSWRRWRTRELLWGTNVERFWPQLKFWDERDSLVAYTLKNHRRRVRLLEDAMRDPRWAHVGFVRLKSSRETAAWLAAVRATASTAATS